MPDLPFQTVTQFVALGLTLIAGWFLGLASSSGGRKWRERYYDEELNSAGYRDRAETDLRDAARRIRDLEEENARLRAAPAVAPEGPRAAVPAPPAAAPAPAAHVEPEGHSTATVVGAALAGAVAGAAVTHAAEQREVSPTPEAHPAEPAPAAAIPAETAHAEPVAETHASPADAVPADAH